MYYPALIVGSLLIFYIGGNIAREASRVSEELAACAAQGNDCTIVEETP